MQCPFCESELFYGGKKIFETTFEHVSDPNMTYFPERDVWICDCDISDGCFWDNWGDFYLGSNRSIIKFFSFKTCNAIR